MGTFIQSIRQADWKKILLTLVRMAIGWHFLYEGIAKLLIPKWTSFSYLSNSSGPFSGLYHWMASTPAVLKTVDILNVSGLLLIGAALFLGLFSRIAAVCGALLLTMYYFAYPPFGDSLFSVSEGHLFIIDKIFIEALVLLFFVLLKEKGYGIDLFAELIKKSRKADQASPAGKAEYSDSRREALKNLATLPFLGLMGIWAGENHKRYGVDVLSGATIQLNRASLGELKGVLPKGKVKDHEISRLILGGNLIGGWAHSRDLLYVPSLFKAYNTEKKIYETLMLAEEAGINAINIGFPTHVLMAKYKRMTGSKIKVICQVAPNMKTGDIYEQINGALDSGCDILQVQGNWCDWLVRDKNTEVIVKMLDRIRSNNLTAGLGAHTIDSLIYCEEQGIIPDYYMKTLHHDNYWSAHPKENRVPFEVDGDKSKDHNKFHDNLFCLFPERTVEFINKTKVPVMGFKVLAAGAIEPKDGFKWAFENGADFICVGMFDFQVVNDVNICLDSLKNLQNRKREWYA
ncbi:MAG: hypothetical protein A2X05_03405 [Bacteroidetes bacterium GWE2_41_25]|nr:MAG: hypothetical protein A2X03_16015 [Bacteroidetes bacterium GWA2_40_15]OFX91825.1 MAG: hypothetical protein A2X05_03405 [Bacteroidetes bacterium GWE2_41_25]OFX94042.1 MAG: hypothetical protein A2X06_14925 [Bacteroidetes bacterium GWC2_40_22]OFY59563.1 MAG: hypothetical protein A2X04_07775 [Bacteroidetes bacterium GWF2_41_9]HBH82193.1 hypothetical protein [Bacteroidales bacterium]